MKKNSLLSVARAGFFVSLAVVLFSTSCSTGNTSKSPETTTPPKWEEQLQHGLDLAKQRGEDQLRLISYEYLGKVESKEAMTALTDDMFADETYTVLSHFNDNFFAILT